MYPSYDEIWLELANSHTKHNLYEIKAGINLKFEGYSKSLSIFFDLEMRVIRQGKIFLTNRIFAALCIYFLL